MKLANEKGCSAAELGVTPKGLAELAKMVEQGQVSASAGNSIFAGMVKAGPLGAGKSPQQIASEQNLLQKSDAGELEGFVDEVIAANPKAVEDAKSGGKKSQKSMSFLIGQVMHKTKGQANPKVVNELLAKKLV